MPFTAPSAERLKRSSMQCNQFTNWIRNIHELCTVEVCDKVEEGGGSSRYSEVGEKVGETAMALKRGKH